MQRIGKEAYLIILGVILLLFGSLAVRTAQVNKQKGGGKPTAADPEFAAMRYPYRQLSAREQRLYNVLYEGIAAHRENIRLPERFTGEEYDRVYLMVMMQEPEFFYVDRRYETGNALEDVTILYTMTQEEAAEAQIRLDAAADTILQQTSPVQNEWQQILTIHDAIGRKCRYGSSLHSDDAYGCLAEGTAMCEGYSKGFLYAVRRAGYEIMCVPGRTGNGTDHVWNIVRIGGHYYNIDLTFDDDNSYLGGTAHNCFAMPDTEFEPDHLPDKQSYFPPPCTDATQTYYKLKGLVLNEPAQLVQRANEWLNQHGQDVTEFYCSEDVPDPEHTLRKLFSGTGRSVYWDEVRRIILITR